MWQSYSSPAICMTGSPVDSDDVVAGTSGYGSARARNKNPRKKTDDRSHKVDVVRQRASVGENDLQKRAAQGPSRYAVASSVDNNENHAKISVHGWWWFMSVYTFSTRPDMSGDTVSRKTCAGQSGLPTYCANNHREGRRDLEMCVCV